MVAYLAEASRRRGEAFTASLGIASKPEHGLEAEAVVRAADRALYAAKRGGRDRVCIANYEPILDSEQVAAE